MFDSGATHERARTRIGQRISRYTVERCTDIDVLGSSYLGSGTEGEVVDLFVLDERLTGDDAVRRELAAAAAVARRAEHASIVVHDATATTPEGIPCCVAPIPRGETWAELLRRRSQSMAPAEVLRICADVLDILAVAHQRDAVHGVLEPRFVHLTESGVALVRGFGMHAARQRAAAVFGLQLPPGTVGFVAPNQILGEPPNAASDVWSATALALHAMTGQFTYPGASETERERSATLGRVRHLGQIEPEAPSSLLDLFEYAFDNSVEAHRLAVRFRDVADVREVRILRHLHDDAARRRSARPPAPDVRTNVSAPPVPQGPRPHGGYSQSQMSPAVNAHAASAVSELDRIDAPRVPVIEKGVPMNRPPRR